MREVANRLFQIALFTLVAVLAVNAQTITTGDVAGTVRDPSGAAVPNANVTLHSKDTGETRTTATNATGLYRFSLLRPGAYTIEAKSAGLLSDTESVAIEVGEAATVDLVAKVQSTSEVIEVNTSAALVNSENADLSQTFSSEQMLQLPAPGGDITTVAFTVPGIVVSTGMGYGNFSSHGLPGTSNLYTINGNDYNDAYLNLNNSGASNLLLGQDEIAEAAVTQNGYSVEYGRQAGAQVNYVTKSGTNAFHSDLLFNFNNHLMNANDFFSNSEGLPRPYSVSRQWGADLGGPIKRDKLFFFTDSEGLYYTLPSVHTVVVPTPQLESYILGNITPSQVPLYTQAFGIYNHAPGVSGAVPITTGSGPLQDSSGSLGCGALAGTAVPGGGTFGVTTPCGLAYDASGLNTNKEWLFTDRVDYNINDKQKVFVRFKTDHGFQPTGTNLLSPSLDEVSNQPQYEGQITYNYVISPTLVNNLIGSVLWYSAIFGPSSVSTASSTFPTYFQIGGAGGANTGGFYPVGVNWTSFPQGRDVGQGQIIDDLSWVKGNHTFKFGVNYRRNRVTDFSYESNSIGAYLFSNLADFANGTLGSSALGTSYYQQKFSPLLDAHIRFYNIGIYAQDEWALKPNLKLTYGIRLDRTADPTCLDDCFSLLKQPFSSSSFQTGASLPYNSSIMTGQSHAYYGIQSIVPDPRVGVAWSPGNKGTVLRGGIGIFSDLSPGVLVASIFNNAPYPYVAQISSGLVSPVTDPASAAAAAQAQYNAFKTGFFAGQTLGQLNASVPGGFSPFPYFSIPSKLQTPNYVEWSFELQQPIGSKDVFVATYSGNHGYNLLLQDPWVNASNAGNLTNFVGLPSASPDPRFSTVTQLTNSGYSNYDGLSVQFRRAFAYGFQGELSYTWSHALDTISNDGAGLAYSFCPGCGLTVMPTPSVAASYGSADYDVRHNVTGDFLWDMPWKFGGHRLMQNVLANWTISGKAFWRTGTPFSIIDSALGGALGGNSLLGTTLLANELVALPGSCGPSAVNTPCFTPSQVTASGAETTLGNLGRNVLRAPDYTDVDLSAFKNINVTEHLRFQIGASAYNVFNHPNFQNPNSDIANPTSFGTISSTAIPPTSAYGSFQGSAVSGRVMVVTGRFQF